MHVLQDASMDVVALLDDQGAVARQYTYDPYGRPIFEETFGTPAHNRLGHHGLFYDPLDTNAPVGELAIDAGGHYYNRNRSYNPQLARFITQDPHGAALSTLQADPLSQSAHSVQPVDLSLHFQDGQNAHLYLRSSPTKYTDPLGLYSSEDALVDSMDVVNLLSPLPGPGDMITGALASMVGTYSQNLEWDAAWASDLALSDSMNTRLSSTWVGVALAYGVYESFDVHLPFTDTSLNPLDAFGSFRYSDVKSGSGRRRHGHRKLHYLPMAQIVREFRKLPDVKGLRVNKRLRGLDGGVLKGPDGEYLLPDVHFWKGGRLHIFEFENTNATGDKKARYIRILEYNGISAKQVQWMGALQ